jgi:hypothetical protein
MRRRKMNNSTILDFLSKHCKANKHSECVGRWNGLDIEVLCYCNCHSKEEEEEKQASALVEEPHANALGNNLPFQERNPK